MKIEIQPGVNAPDPNTCHWCGQPLTVWYQPDVPGRSGNFYCECKNSACIACDATGAVSSYPTVAAAVVVSRRQVSQPALDIDDELLGWLREMQRNT